MTEWFLDIVLGTCLVLCALAIQLAPRLYTGVVLYIGFGLLVALTWARLGVPDLALAEAAIGAGLMGVLLLNALSQLPEGRSRRHQPTHRLLTVVTGIALAVLLWRAIEPLDGLTSPLPDLVYSQLSRTGVEHPVTAVLLNIRAWDTLLELLVALLAVLGLKQLQLPSLQIASPWPLLSAWSLWLAPLSLLMGCYLLWRGAFAPGGAFQAGALWASGAVILRLNGRLPTLSWRHPGLRFLVVAGLVVFLAVTLTTALWGQAWLSYPPEWAKTLILTIEIAASLSIATSLTLLVVAENEELKA